MYACLGPLNIKKHLFHKAFWPRPEMGMFSLEISPGVKSAIEISSHHAQPSKTWSCDWEVSGTALGVITVSAINNMSFSLTVCLSAICWALRHKLGRLPVAGRPCLGWSLGGQGPGTSGGGLPVTSVHVACSHIGVFFAVFPCSFQMTFRCLLM